MKNDFTFDEWFEERQYQYESGFRSGVSMGLSISCFAYALISFIAKLL